MPVHFHGSASSTPSPMLTYFRACWYVQQCVFFYHVGDQINESKTIAVRCTLHGSYTHLNDFINRSKVKGISISRTSICVSAASTRKERDKALFRPGKLSFDEAYLCD